MLLYGHQIPAGLTHSTVIADMDFETYSEAGFVWSDETGKWVALHGATSKGIGAVGARVYAEHPTAEPLCLYYDLKDGRGRRLWLPGLPDPVDLFDHFLSGKLIEAWNCQFEYWFWNLVMVPKYGWPELPYWLLRDAMAKARAYALPGKLEKAGDVLNITNKKLDDGKRLLNKFSIPRSPTKKDPRRRIRPFEDPADALNLYKYNERDTVAEAEISSLCPDLSERETQAELCTRLMNIRGVALDMETINAGIQILDTAIQRYDAELPALTGGAVEKATQTARITNWLGTLGVHTKSIDAEHIEQLLARPDLPVPARRVIEIRKLIGSAGVKKLYAMQRMASSEGRAHDLIAYHVARTGRDGGQDIQPQNLVKAGPPLFVCEQCGKQYGKHLDGCPFCRTQNAFAEPVGWSHDGVEQAVNIIRTGSLDLVESIYGDAVLTLSGCIRGMFVAGPNKDLICSDYSSIEAVVTAVLAGEQWRIEAFRREEDIYLHGASGVTGISYDEYKQYFEQHGHKHPDRSKIGKPAELGLGFGGYVGAWRQFDSSDNFTDGQVKHNVMAWREKSPMIVELWGGQVRGKPWAPERYELFGLEGAAISAILSPGQAYQYRMIAYMVKDDVLYCKLPSGRYLTYHKPRLAPSERWEGQYQISFEGYNSNPKMGPIGWVRMKTYGGKLAENCIQATARDYMFHAIPLLEQAGYPIVLRVHDELVAEIPEGFGSIEEFEQIMQTPPSWAQDWPIRAAGGWRGKRYRKD